MMLVKIFSSKITSNQAQNPILVDCFNLKQSFLSVETLYASEDTLVLPMTKKQATSANRIAEFRFPLMDFENVIKNQF